MTVLSFIFLLAALIVLLVLLVIYILMFFALLTTRVPFVPVPADAVSRIIDQLDLPADAVFYDLGCGDGRVLKAAIERYPGIKAVGVEKAPIPYLLARFRTRKHPGIEIRRADIFKTDVSDATHVYLYLFPKVVTRLLPKLEKECTPGTKVFSCDFRSAQKQPAKTIPLGQPSKSLGKELFVYII